MIHGRIKDVLFIGIRQATRLNYTFRRYVYPLRRPGAMHLNVGCGDKYLEGFVNIDANPLRRLDLWVDARNGLPFRDASVDSIYTSQMLEHFYVDDVERMLAEFLRVLKPGGIGRMVVPHLGSAIQAYVSGRFEWFGNWPHKRSSMGGRFANFIFADGQHRDTFDFPYMREVMSAAGFIDIVELAPLKSNVYSAEMLQSTEEERDPLPHLLCVEGRKPA